MVTMVLTVSPHIVPGLLLCCHLSDGVSGHKVSPWSSRVVMVTRAEPELLLKTHQALAFKWSHGGKALTGTRAQTPAPANTIATA